MRSKTKKLTRREKQLFDSLLAGKSLADAAREYGYKGKYPRQAGYDTLQNLTQKVPDLFERHGLDDDSFIANHVLARLNAKAVRVFKGEKGLIYSKPLEDNTTRMAATRLVAEMKGMLVREREQPGSGIKCIVINAAYRPARRGPIPIATVPGLSAPLTGRDGPADGMEPPRTLPKGRRTL